jgi:hypothetical protein
MKGSSEFIDNRSAEPPAGMPLQQILQGWPNLMGHTYMTRTAGMGLKHLNVAMRRREWFIRKNLITEDEDLEDRKVVRRLREWKKTQKHYRRN